MKIKIPVIYPSFIEKKEHNYKKYMYPNLNYIDFDIQELNNVETVAIFKTKINKNKNKNFFNENNLFYTLKKNLGTEISEKIREEIIDKIDEIEIKKYQDKYYYKCQLINYRNETKISFENEELKEIKTINSTLETVKINNIEKYLNNLYSILQAKANSLKSCYDYENPNNNLFLLFQNNDNNINNMGYITYRDPKDFSLKQGNDNLLSCFNAKNIHSLKEMLKNKTENKNNTKNGKNIAINLYKKIEKNNDFIIINNELWCSGELPIIYEEDIQFNETFIKKYIEYKPEYSNYITEINENFLNDYKKYILNKNLELKAMELIKIFLRYETNLYLNGYELEEFLKQNNIFLSEKNVIEKYKEDYYNDRKKTNNILLKFASSILKNEHNNIIEIKKELEKIFIENKAIVFLNKVIENKNKILFEEDFQTYDFWRNIETISNSATNISNEINKFNNFIENEYNYQDININEITENTLKI